MACFSLGVTRRVGRRSVRFPGVENSDMRPEYHSVARVTRCDAAQFWLANGMQNGIHQLYELAI